MASIVIFDVEVSGFSGTDDVSYSGRARCSGMAQNDSPLGWDTGAISPGSLATTVNAAIKDAAIASATDANFIIGALDKKTLIGGAVGL